MRRGEKAWKAREGKLGECKWSCVRSLYALPDRLHAFEMAASESSEICRVAKDTSLLSPKEIDEEHLESTLLFHRSQHMNLVVVSYRQKNEIADVSVDAVFEAAYCVVRIGDSKEVDDLLDLHASKERAITTLVLHKKQQDCPSPRRRLTKSQRRFSLVSLRVYVHLTRSSPSTLVQVKGSRESLSASFVSSFHKSKSCWTLLFPFSGSSASSKERTNKRNRLFRRLFKTSILYSLLRSIRLRRKKRSYQKGWRDSERSVFRQRLPSVLFWSSSLHYFPFSCLLSSWSSSSF